MIERARLQTLRAHFLGRFSEAQRPQVTRWVDALIESARVVGRDGERARLRSGIDAAFRDEMPEEKVA